MTIDVLLEQTMKSWPAAAEEIEECREEMHGDEATGMVDKFPIKAQKTTNSNNLYLENNLIVNFKYLTSFCLWITRYVST